MCVYMCAYVCGYTHYIHICICLYIQTHTTHTYIYKHHVGSITPDNSTNTVGDTGDSAGAEPGEGNTLSHSAPSDLCID